jgi:alcohol dehydrogenase
MRAAIYEAFCQPLAIRNLPDPVPEDDGVVLKVEATGICRSDWHGWMGNDADIQLPHVPGHELAGTVEETGKNVKNWKRGDRVTVPFVSGCGRCLECRSGNHHICDHQFQPGFTHWGSFAEYVGIHYADINLVPVPPEMDFVTAASLGCRFITSFRAVVAQGQVKPGQWVAVHGCGGVGLSAVMIAQAMGAQVIAVDIQDRHLDLAREVGAMATVNPTKVGDVVEAVREISDGGAHVSLDALGHPDTCFNSVANLRKRGKHIQVGIMEAGFHHSKIPIDAIIGRELEIIGSHGMQAHAYQPMMQMIMNGRLQPEKLIYRTIDLEESLDELARMNEFRNVGVTVINKF